VNPPEARPGESRSRFYAKIKIKTGDKL